MRRAIVVGLSLAGGLWLLVGLLGPQVTADTPTVVVPADDVILLLPVAPPVDRIVADLSTEFLWLAATSTDSRIAESFGRFAEDHDLLRQVATTPVEMFDSGQVAATATPVFDVNLRSGQVTVVVTTVELIPGYGPTAISRDHEDGHALINRVMTQRCADDALAASLRAGRNGEAIIDGMVAFITSGADSAHELYHGYAAGGNLGEHTAHAWRALTETEQCR